MNSFKKGMLSTGVLLSVSSLPLVATATSVDELSQRIEKLETKQSPAAKASNLEVSGVIETEYGYSKDYADESSSDIALATVEIGIEAALSERVSAHILFLHEDDDTEPMEVDEAVLSIAEGGLTFSAGRMYLPFGNFESNMVSDPFTLEIAETREAAFQFAYDVGGLSTSAYIFNGDSSDGDEKAEIYGLNLGFADDSDNFAYDFGLDYISSIADSDGLSGGVASVDALEDYVAGISVHANFLMGASNLFIEYVQAADDFAVTELAFDGEGAQPSALNIEFGQLIELNGTEVQFALAYQTTEESVALELPETRLLAAASFSIIENVAMGVEIASDSDYSTDEGGSDEDATTLTIQLAVEF